MTRVLEIAVPAGVVYLLTYAFESFGVSPGMFLTIFCLGCAFTLSLALYQILKKDY